MEFDGVGTLLARYSHGDRTDQPLSVERAGQSFFYHADHRGSVRLITDAAGFVVNSYEYDSYGNIESSIEGIANPYTFTGREFDAESGLYFYRARYYDPETGRFITEDPIHFAAGDVNLYRDVFNNPANVVDPFGLFCLSPEAIGAISGAAGGATTGIINGSRAGPWGAAGGAVIGAIVGAGAGAGAASVESTIEKAAVGAGGGIVDTILSKVFGVTKKISPAGTVGGAAAAAVGGGPGGAAGAGAAAAIDTFRERRSGVRRILGRRARILRRVRNAVRAGGTGGVVSTIVDIYLTNANNCDEC